MISVKDIYAALLNIKSNSISFFKSKGFSKENIAKHHLFQLEKVKITGALEGLTDKYIDILQYYEYVIPGFNERNELDYLALRRSESYLKKKEDGIHKHIYFGDVEKGLGKIFNSYHLCDSSNIVFIVETWTDALSLEEIGYSAIAMNRVANCHTVLEPLIKKHFKQIQNKTFIVMCDSDEIGVAADKDISEMLKANNIKTFVFNNYPQGIKDANEWLVSDLIDFKEKVNSFIKEL